MFAVQVTKYREIDYVGNLEHMRAKFKLSSASHRIGSRAKRKYCIWKLLLSFTHSQKEGAIKLAFT